jgi:WhiB family transcriptional regulator, redox-sensing transcriptional regulator
MTDVGSWRDRAACRDAVTADYDPFFADSTKLQLEAIAICATCPVRDDCPTFAVRTGQQYGIWGGQPQQMVRRLVALDRAAAPTAIGRRRVIPRPARPTASAAIALKPKTPTTLRTASVAAAPGLRQAQPARGARGPQGGGPDAA